MPSGRAMTTARNSAANASSSVAGMRSTINLSAGSPKMKDFPRSPLTALERKNQYCSCTGRSSPNARIVFSISAWSASGLISMSTGSPTTFTAKKTSSDITATTTMLCSSRRMMKTDTDPETAGGRAHSLHPPAG